MSAFWDDLASDMEDPEFAGAFIEAGEELTALMLGQVPCPSSHDFDALDANSSVALHGCLTCGAWV